MFDKVIGRLGCAVGQHRRSRRQAKLDGLFYVSRCAHCGVAMRQNGDGGWEVDTGQPRDSTSSRFLDLD